MRGSGFNGPPPTPSPTPQPTPVPTVKTPAPTVKTPAPTTTPAPTRLPTTPTPSNAPPTVPAPSAGAGIADGIAAVAPPAMDLVDVVSARGVPPGPISCRLQFTTDASDQFLCGAISRQARRPYGVPHGTTVTLTPMKYVSTQEPPAHAARAIIA